ncbi:hypothetical protein [Capnocytophaga sp.]|uniref:hypothetical protein n=1 Tax=Capnocytophaga sp. TaxID=44737 RepID=UPI0026DAEDC7|nr:hypothetical protein [Capnocytophaga sp.]MDO5106172.1 hypothetical protein [Capnocytophaga sp.]
MFCWIIPIIVGLICALLGYLLGRMCSPKTNQCTKNDALDECEQKRSRLEKELADQTDALSAKNRENSDLLTRIKELEVALKAAEAKAVENVAPVFMKQETPVEPVSRFMFDAAKAALVLGKKIKEDDLTIVEGIGPKIQELFKERGIVTWKILSETSAERLKEILTEGGDRFAIHNPGTWPRQAELAYQGKWEELKEWQDFLVGGVEPS